LAAVIALGLSAVADMVALGPVAMASAAAPDAPARPADGSLRCAPGVPVGPDGAAFYTPPSPLPSGHHGDLIWADRVSAPRRSHACRILYMSTLHDGTPVAVSGIVLWPDGSGPDGSGPDGSGLGGSGRDGSGRDDSGPRDGRPVVAWAHGTVGGPQQCAPSAPPKPAVDLDDYFSFQSPYGIDVGVPALTDFLAEGDVVVATDYQGLGTPGVHQYVVAATETNNVLDSVLAARQIRAAHAGHDTAVLGWSQGGGAALFVGQDATGYARDVHVVGVAALAPAADLGPEFRGLVLPGPSTATSRSHNAALRVNVYRGFLAAYPELKASDVLQPAGVQALAGDGVACIEHFADVIQSNYAETNQMDTLFQKLRDVPQSWYKRFDENTAGYSASEAPVLVMQGTDDSVINPHSTAQYIRRACKFSQAVEYTTYAGATHQTIPFVARAEYLGWIADRFAGRVAPSNC
jgi:alpha-beta hydrolase superfamily lysophospholipase